MDPDEALRQIRLLVKQLAEEDGNPPYPMFVQHARDLAEQVEALDEWLTKGGFAPATWSDRKPRGLWFSREQVERWVGHGLSDEQVEQIEATLPDSSLPQCVEAVAHEGLGFDDYRRV